MPELVRGEPDVPVKALAYADFFVLAVKALQELDAKLEAKDAQIADLTTRLERLERAMRSSRN